MLCLFIDYNYAHLRIDSNSGSFRVLQRYALRASTAAPTVFKPVMMGGEMYCDGGIVASNPSAVAVHEARCIFPDIPIELVVSVGTGGK
jgi:calcium-independent phospholipase A2-gamma